MFQGYLSTRRYMDFHIRLRVSPLFPGRLRISPSLARYVVSARMLFAATLISGLVGCATPMVQRVTADRTAARMEDSHIITGDGEALPLSVWQTPEEPQAIVLALHGFYEYRHAFEGAGPFLAERGISVYAYDQRGFGGTTGRGIWAGSDRLVNDVRTVAALLREKHPGKPLYLIGESMGGAVAINVLARTPHVAEGVVLIAPAVWGRAAMNPLQRAVFWVMAHSAPSMKLTGQGLKIMASDNIAMLRALGKDPMVIKGARVDALWGLSNLMDRALETAPALSVPTLVLYGERDQIIPRRPICWMLADLAPSARAAVYPTGYHMLTRDLGADVVLQDLAGWLLNARAALPSGMDGDGRQRLCSVTNPKTVGDTALKTTRQN